MVAESEALLAERRREELGPYASANEASIVLVLVLPVTLYWWKLDDSAAALVAACLLSIWR